MSIIRAIAFATKKHMGQWRANGSEPYVAHPIRVAEHAEMAGLGHHAIIAGVLHDVIEDCEEPAQSSAFIQREWPESWTLVDLLTKKDDDKDAYYGWIRRNLAAVNLKLLDRADNLEDMFKMLRATPRVDTIKGNLRWAQSYLKKSVLEINPLCDETSNRYVLDTYHQAKGRLINIVNSV